MDRSMSWEPQIDCLRAKLRCLAGRFYGLAEVADARSKRVAYCSLVESILNYAITVWGGASSYVVERLERSQNSVVRNVSMNGRSEHKDYYESQLLKVKELFVYRVVIQNYFKGEFRVEREKQRPTRQETQYQVSETINKYGERSRLNCVPRLLNSIPREIRRLNSIGALKRDLKVWLLQRYL